MTKSFNLELTSAFLSADISLCKIENAELKSFLRKYTRHHIPSESLLRKCYLKLCYDNVMDKIKQKLVGRKLWVSIDETTDSCGRGVANCVVGVLSPNVEECKSYLINTATLESTNSNTIAQFFDDSLNIFGIKVLNKDDILLLVTDAAPYMVKAGNGLTLLYPKLIHITCLAHALHRLSEQIRLNFPNVDLLIANCKKIFIKAPKRIEIFKDNAPYIPLPPKPIIVRWGTWINAAIYYNDNFELVANVLGKLDEEEAASIAITKKLLLLENIRNELIYISSNYGFLPGLIENLEKQNLHICESIVIYEKVWINICSAQGDIAKCIKNKLTAIFNKNGNFRKIEAIAKIIQGTNNNCMEAINNLSNKEILCFKYAPVTTSDVERSFSRYKNLLRPNRQLIKDENISLYTIPYCNTFNE